MTIAVIATIIRALWLLLEYPYLRRYKVTPVKDWDKRSALFWDVAGAIELVGIIFGFTNIGHLESATDLSAATGLGLLFAGIIIRWAAIYDLGKYFTSTVLIKDDHRLIQSGLYKHLRHPAYSGALLAHLGLGLSFSNWISLGCSLLPFILAASYRIHVEERALREAFGEAYVSYSRGTKRLIPKLF